MKSPTFVQIRAGLLFGSGLAGVAYETLVSQADRPTLLILFAAMLGLPLFLRADEKANLTSHVKSPVVPGPTEQESADE